MKPELVINKDGSLTLSLGDEGMETDLIFAEGAIDKNDPLWNKQHQLIQQLLKRLESNEAHNHSTANSPELT